MAAKLIVRFTKSKYVDHVKGHAVDCLEEDQDNNKHWPIYRYKDDNTLVPDEDHERRPCKLCNKKSTEDGHDPCIANLPGVVGCVLRTWGHGRLSLLRERHHSTNAARRGREERAGRGGVVSKKWKFELNDALYDEVLREAVAVAEAEADAAERDLRLTQMLGPTIQAMLLTGATPRQIAAVLRCAADAGELAQDEEEGKRR